MGFLGQWLGQDLGQEIGQNFSSHSVKARFADGAYTGASACSVDYGGEWTDFAGGVAPVVTIGGRKVIQIETASENVITRARELDDGIWAKSSATISDDITTAPDGTTTADNLVESSDPATQHKVNQTMAGVISNGENYVFSIYAKSAGRRYMCLQFSLSVGGYCYFDLESGSIGAHASTDSQGIEYIGDGWYRCWVHSHGTADGNVICTIYLAEGDQAGNISYDGDGTSGNYFWNAQLENGCYPSSPINSGAAANTRTKDVFKWLSADVPAALRGTFTFQWIPYWGSDYLGDVTLVEFDESGASDNIRVWYDATDQKIYVDDETGVSTLVTSDALTITRFDVLTITINPTTGGITVAGATAGNCDNTDTPWTPTTAGDVYWGNNEADGEQCEGLISEPY